MTNSRTLGCRLMLSLIVSAGIAQPQLWQLTPEQLTQLTAKNPFDRFADGRPKVPDALLEKLRTMDIGIEDMVGTLREKGFQNQFEAGPWKRLNLPKKLVGRVFTVQFMPSRPDLTEGLGEKGRMRNQTAIDMLQPGDVVVVDLFGKIESGTFVGDKLAYYVWKTTGTGMVIDGAMFYLSNIEKTGMPAFYRGAYPSALSGVTLTGVNIPIQIGKVTVMPGDVVFGDQESLLFIPPQLVEGIVTSFESTQSRFEWIKKKFDERKYKSSEIYGRPKDLELLKEMEEYIKARAAKK